MSSLIDPRLRGAMRKGAPTALLAQFDIPRQAPTYLWSRSGTLPYGGHDWLGAGALGTISGMTATTALAVNQVVFTLKGIPPSRAPFINTIVRQGRAQVWLAAIKARRVVSTPELVVDAQLDYATLNPGDDGKVAMKIYGNVGFWKIGSAIDLVWSHEQQQVDFPGDTGLSLMHTFASKVSNWRKEDV